MEREAPENEKIKVLGFFLRHIRDKDLTPAIVQFVFQRRADKTVDTFIYQEQYLELVYMYTYIYIYLFIHTYI